MTGQLEHPHRLIRDALSDGRARTLVEIAAATGLGRTHVARCLDALPAGELHHDRQHRHHYVALKASRGANVSATAKGQRFGPRDARLRAARTCYGHFAGDLGIAITDALVSGGYLRAEDGGYAVSPAGLRWFTQLGLALEPARLAMPHKQCLDWSWRRPHVGGALGRALVLKAVAENWVARGTFHSRGVTISATGKRALSELLGLSWPLPLA